VYGCCVAAVLFYTRQKSPVLAATVCVCIQNVCSFVSSWWFSLVPGKSALFLYHRFLCAQNNGSFCNKHILLCEIRTKETSFWNNLRKKPYFWLNPDGVVGSVFFPPTHVNIYMCIYICICIWYMNQERGRQEQRKKRCVVLFCCTKKLECVYYKCICNMYKYICNMYTYICIM